MAAQRAGRSVELKADSTAEWWVVHLAVWKAEPKAATTVECSAAK